MSLVVQKDAEEVSVDRLAGVWATANSVEHSKVPTESAVW